MLCNTEPQHRGGVQAGFVFLLIGLAGWIGLCRSRLDFQVVGCILVCATCHSSSITQRLPKVWSSSGGRRAKENKPNWASIPQALVEDISAPLIDQITSDAQAQRQWAGKYPSLMETERGSKYLLNNKIPYSFLSSAFVLVLR